MKNSKRVQRALSHLDAIRVHLDYYSNGDNALQKEITELYEILEELSLDKKEDHVRLAKKLKAHWDRDHNSDS